ncbi:MAG TPA: nuclear transport factor 2 family protein [Pseudonocardia sp.]|uniref:nuclear transport factor 2 family protein n=1 Tax=Pseudonocardia sp. TaxID=60912 RepID=UPI002B859A9D|nr:nuclear transport factor 2 family protein [Pseudonocardia sp.]HTF48357.1 nuclear transport factor 2 family protein [Pseudonocardia sp.]
MGKRSRIQEVLARYVRATDARDGAANFMAPHPPLGSSHHVTADHMIEVDGDTARLNAQYVAFEVRGGAPPAGGWPAGALGVQGTVRPIEVGYYDTELRLVHGAWKITRHVLQDLPFALPDAGPAPSGRA